MTELYAVSTAAPQSERDAIYEFFRSFKQVIWRSVDCQAAWTDHVAV